MDDIDRRLKEASENCIKCYEGWSKNQKDSSIREAMMEAIHELRKVAARLEIEMAISERNEMTSKPIPIPAHRSTNRKGNAGSDDNNPPMPDDNGSEGMKIKQTKVERKGAPRRRRTGGSDN